MEPIDVIPVNWEGLKRWCHSFKITKLEDLNTAPLRIKSFIAQKNQRSKIVTELTKVMAFNQLTIKKGVQVYADEEEVQ